MTSTRPPPLFWFHTTHLCHSVFSCFSPLCPVQLRLVAREKEATRLPPVVERISGSLPRFPISIALFRLRLTNPPREKCRTVYPSLYIVCRQVSRGHERMRPQAEPSPGAVNSWLDSLKNKRVL